MSIDWPKKFKDNRVSFNLDNVKEMVEGLQGLEKISLETGVLRDSFRQKLAYWHEYGTFRSTSSGKVAHVPARSFIRSTNKEAEKDLIPEFQVGLVDFILKKRKLFPDREEVRAFAIKSLNSLGEKLKIAMKTKILNHIPPRLKPGTVKGKKRAGYPFPSTPLFATGKMWQSIDYRVRERGRFTAKEGG